MAEVSNTVVPDTDRPRPANNLLNFFFHGIAVKGPKISEILFRITKFTFAVIALVIRIHNYHMTRTAPRALSLQSY